MVKVKIMRIFIDADACPRVIKEILCRAAIRTQTPLILVANHVVQIPKSSFIRLITVAGGFDVADKKIAEEVAANDLVITADIPLADIVVSKSAIALNPRGTLYTAENIKHKLAMRNLMEHLRDNQLISGGPPTLNKTDHQALARQLDRILGAKLDLNKA
jgi:uncharacterized protein YaiI (UPF0178 family)